MVTAAFIGWLGFCFIGMTILNRILEGVFIAAADVEIANQVTVFRSLNIYGLFTVPVPNLSFITEGIPRLVKWDYSFFGGNAGIIQYFLYSVTFALSFILFVLIIGLLYQYFNRLR